MLIGTHALLPVCGCLLADQIVVASGRGRIIPPMALWAVAVFGALPDLCSPHLSLEARYASWSHTVWFMAGLIAVAAMTGSFFENGCRLATAIACWIATALHLVADAVSGGIAWLYPWSDEVIGRYYIPPQQWIWFDAFFILFTWYRFRLIPHLEARRIREAQSLEDP